MPSRLAPLCAVLFAALAGCASTDLLVDNGGEGAGVAVASSERGGYPAPVGPMHATATSDDVGATGSLGRFVAMGGDEPYRLDTGDRLRVFVYGQPNLSRLYTVDQSGTITVPLIGPVTARGLTTSQLERGIGKRLATNLVRDPQVTVDVSQNRPFFILGEVRTPGQYPFVSSMTVETAVAIAGGYTERASDKVFRISRRSNGGVVQIEVPAQSIVQPGDTVFVYERFL